MQKASAKKTGGNQRKHEEHVTSQWHLIQTVLLIIHK